MDVKSQAKYEDLYSKKEEVISGMHKLSGARLEWSGDIAKEDLEEVISLNNDGYMKKKPPEVEKNTLIMVEEVTDAKTEDLVKANFSVGLLQGVQYPSQGFGSEVLERYGAHFWATGTEDVGTMIMGNGILKNVELVDMMQ